MNDSDEMKGWKYYLLKKRYPAWIYAVVLGLFAVIIYIWIRYLLGIE